MRRRSAVLLAVLPVLLGGCASRMERATLMQASHDLQCPQDQLTVQELSFGEYRAAGCGQEASYQLIGECYFDWNPCRAAPLAKRAPEAKKP